MLKHIIPMQLTEENAKIPLDITDDDSIRMELEETTIEMLVETFGVIPMVIEDAQDIPMTVRLFYGDDDSDSTAIAGLAIAGVAIAGVA